MAASGVGRDDGTIGVTGVAAGPPQESIIAAESSITVRHDGDDILFVTQLHRPGLSLPGGLLKKGEQARSALTRELAEELGLRSIAFADVPDTAHVDPGKTRVDLLFLAPIDRSTVTPRPGLEVLSFQWRTAQDPELTPQTLAAVAGRLAS